MSNDIVERLRLEMRGERHAGLAREAADEIERLEAALADIADSQKRDWIDPAEHANWCIERAKENLA